jgi:S-DNA-T family DNA segregation ATPase FtsK/SpoIIIE
MAKKKKRTSKAKKSSKSTKKDATPNYFRRQVWAFVLILVGLLIGLGAFGVGGSLPVALFKGSSWLFGFVAFLLPLLLFYMAIHKLRHEEYLIPIKILVSSFILLIATSGMLHSAIDRVDASASASAGTWGGHVGNLVSNLFLNFLNSYTTMIVLLVISVFALLVLMNVSIKNMFTKLVDSFRREDSDEEYDDDDDEDEPKKVNRNENVPVVHNQVEPKPSHRPKLVGFKNSTPEPVKVNDNHSALLLASDPNWKYPSLNILSAKQKKADPGDVEGNADRIKQALANFGIDATMEDANISARVTQYTLRVPQGVKMSKIANLSDNISYELGATSVRIEAPIPGQKAVGVEVPNKESATVTLKSLLKRPEWANQKSKLAFAIGQDISGKPVYADLDAMPHLLIAGQTKSGKSVMVNALLTSLLYANTPSDLKLILVDPKFVEMGPYNDIPHLLTPVINEPDKCVSALKWAVAEMERRYKKLQSEGVREIHAYNDKMPDEKMPYIVIVIDELADLMQMAARDVEALIVRIAQKARAVGIHLVLATQSPRVTVITGLIKANVPARIAFTVSQEVESRIILDTGGADKLLGYGDMLFKTSDMPKPVRVQGSLMTTDETQRLTDYLREQQTPVYDDEIISLPVQFNGKGGIVPDTGSAGSGSSSGQEDEVFKDAVGVVIDSGKASTSLLQRRLRIGYGRASRIIDEMEDRGIIGVADGARPREVLVSSIEEAFGGGGSQIDVLTPEDSDDPRDEFLTR